jgi:hypothetical protein
VCWCVFPVRPLPLTPCVHTNDGPRFSPRQHQHMCPTLHDRSG